MLKSYLTTAFRFLLKNKSFSFINLFGLTAGTLCCLYIFLYVRDQYSYDRQHPDLKDLYRITTIWTGPNDIGNWATATAPVAPAIANPIKSLRE